MWKQLRKLCKKILEVNAELDKIGEEINNCDKDADKALYRQLRDEFNRLLGSMNAYKDVLSDFVKEYNLPMKAFDMQDLRDFLGIEEEM